MAEPATRYGRPARLFHWIGALIVLTMIPVGLWMVQQGLPRSLQNTLYIYHKNIGVLALALVVVRLGWRLIRGAPAPTGQAWQRRAAALSHTGLYVLLFVLPLSGYVRVRAGGFPIEALDAMGVPALVPRSDALADTAQALHYWAGLALMALVALHFAAALYHALIRRDGVWQRMWPPFGKGSAP
jgi:cytochrome b561